MAHELFRQITEHYHKLIASSPIVGIFGHRQTGKTTLANQLSSNYVTFDAKKVRDEASEDAERFLARRKAGS